MKILILGDRLLVPADTGGKIRSFNLFKRIAKRHEVVYLSLVYPNDKKEYIDEMESTGIRVVGIHWKESEKYSIKFYLELLRATFSRYPYIMKKYFSDNMVQSLKEEVSKGDYDLILCDFLQPALNLRGISEIPTLLFQHNVEAVIRKRHYKEERNLIKKLCFYIEWKKLFQWEKIICSKLDYVITVSQKDTETIQKDYSVFSVKEIPTGVDTEYFTPADNVSIRNNLIFTGSMDWLPNEDAMLYFCQEIFPLIRQGIPDIKLTIVGRNPTKSIQRLGQDDPSVIVTGRVEDIRPFMRESGVYIVPLRIGGGTRIKIYEAMAMGIPIVSTDIGAEGLPVAHNKNILLSNDPEEFSVSVIRLLKEPELYKKIWEEGRELVVEKYGWENAASSMEEIFQKVLAYKTN